MDLLRAYKMILKRRDSAGSEESQPLASSPSSTASFGSLDRCTFNDPSSTEDFEAGGPSPKPFLDGRHVQAAPKTTYPGRPFCYPSHAEYPDIFAEREHVYEKCQYYAKVSGILTDNNFVTSTYLSLKYEKLETFKTQPSVVTIFAIWNTIMGTSLLAMAWGFERAGLVAGIFLHLIVSGVCLYTAKLIVETSKEHALTTGGVSEVPELCKHLLGRWAEIAARIFSLVVLIGANIVYWILMSNFLFNSVDFIYDYVMYPEIPDNRTVICPRFDVQQANSSSVDQTKGTFRSVWDLYRTVPLFLALLMFPLLNFKSVTFFTKFNSLGTLSAVYMVIFVCVKGATWGISEMDWTVELGVKSSFSALSGMLALSYFIHNIVISVMRSNKHQENNVRDLSVAYFLVVFTYLFVGVVLYVTFPLAKSCIEDNILNNFPKYDPMTIGARVLLLFQLFTVFPLMSYMLRMDIFNNVRVVLGRAKVAEPSYPKVVALNVALIVVCVLFACFLPKIGTLIRYTGALSGMVYVFALPSLLRIATLRNEKALTPFKCALCVTIIVLGVLNFCSQFFIADN